MNVTQSDNTPVLIIVAGIILLAVIACAASAWSGALDLHLGSSPEQDARADTLRQMGIQATAQALQIQRDQAAVDLADRARWAETRQQWAGWLLTFGVGMLIGLGGILLVLAIGGVLTWIVGRSIALARAAQAPAVQVVDDHHHLTVVGGQVYLINNLSGRASLLTAGQDPDTQTAYLAAGIEVAKHVPPPEPPISIINPLKADEPALAMPVRPTIHSSTPFPRSNTDAQEV